MFAQTQMPDAVTLAGWLASLMFVVGLVNGCLKLADRVKGRPAHPPNEMLGQSAQELARRMQIAEQKIDESDKRRKSLYDRIESSGNHTRSLIDALKEQVTAGLDALRREVKNDVEAVHEKINGVATAQGGHETAIEMLNQLLAQMSSTMQQRFRDVEDGLRTLIQRREK